MTKADARALQHALAATPDCVSIERLSEVLTPREQEHVGRCPRCQTELELWHQFANAHPSSEEGAAVQWITAELARRRAQPIERPAAAAISWLTPRFHRWAAALATLAVVIAIGYAAWDREPRIREPMSSGQTYRSAQIRAGAPLGEVRSAPAALEWDAVSGAARYEVEVFEVDRTPLWHGTSTESRIDLPPSVVARLVPGKTVLWEVRARNAANDPIAESGTQRFRVEVPSRLPKD